MVNLVPLQNPKWLLVLLVTIQICYLIGCFIALPDLQPQPPSYIVQQRHEAGLNNYHYSNQQRQLATQRQQQQKQQQQQQQQLNDASLQNRTQNNSNHYKNNIRKNSRDFAKHTTQYKNGNNNNNNNATTTTSAHSIRQKQSKNNSKKSSSITVNEDSKIMNKKSQNNGETAASTNTTIYVYNNNDNNKQNKNITKNNTDTDTDALVNTIKIAIQLPPGPPLDDYFDRPHLYGHPVPLIIGGSDGSGTRSITTMVRNLNVPVVIDDAGTMDVDGNPLAQGKGWPPLVESVLNITHLAANYTQAMFQSSNQDSTYQQILHELSSYMVEMKERAKGIKDQMQRRNQTFSHYVDMAFKAPCTMLLLPFLQQLMPRMKFIHVVRDGRDVALSKNKSPVRKFYKSYSTKPSDTYERRGMYNIDEIDDLKAMELWNEWNVQVYKYTLQQIQTQVPPDDNETNDRVGNTYNNNNQSNKNNNNNNSTTTARRRLLSTRISTNTTTNTTTASLQNTEAANNNNNDNYNASSDSQQQKQKVNSKIIRRMKIQEEQEEQKPPPKLPTETLPPPDPSLTPFLDVLVIRTEDFVRDSYSTMLQVADFVGSPLTPKEICCLSKAGLKDLGKSAGNQNPASRDQLRRHYKERMKEQAAHKPHNTAEELVKANDIQESRRKAREEFMARRTAGQRQRRETKLIQEENGVANNAKQARQELLEKLKREKEERYVQDEFRQQQHAPGHHNIIGQNLKDQRKNEHELPADKEQFAAGHFDYLHNHRHRHRPRRLLEEVDGNKEQQHMEEEQVSDVGTRNKIPISNLDQFLLESNQPRKKINKEQTNSKNHYEQQNVVAKNTNSVPSAEATSQIKQQILQQKQEHNNRRDEELLQNHNNHLSNPHHGSQHLPLNARLSNEAIDQLTMDQIYNLPRRERLQALHRRASIQQGSVEHIADQMHVKEQHSVGAELQKRFQMEQEENQKSIIDDTESLRKHELAQRLAKHHRHQPRQLDLQQGPKVSKAVLERIQARYGKWVEYLQDKPEMSQDLHSIGKEGLELFGYEPPHQFMDYDDNDFVFACDESVVCGK